MNSIKNILQSTGIVVLLAFLWVGVVPSAHAQFSSDHQTITINAVTNSSAGTYFVGATNSFDELIISNNGALYSGGGVIGNTGTNNRALINGAGSIWTNLNLTIGYAASGNSLFLTNGGAAKAETLVIGAVAGASNNLVLVAGGILTATNNSATGSLVIGQAGQGQLILEAGTVTADSLWITNGGQSVMTFNSGWLASGGTTVTNGQLFTVGDGIDAATLFLSGGEHSFANGLEIRNAATLSDCGTVDGTVVVDAGGTVAAICGGTLNFTGAVTNNGNLFASNITSINFFGPVVNNGEINATNGYVTFYSTFQNNGTYLNGGNDWTNSSSGKWEQALNWSAGAPNVQQMTLTLTNSSSKTVTIDSVTAGTPATLLIRRLLVAGPTDTTNTLWLNAAGPAGVLQAVDSLTVDTNGAIVVNNSGLVATNATLYIGNLGGNASVIVTNGGSVVAASVFMGNATSSSGNVAVVTGSGSVWSNTGNFLVGIAGTGNQLAITNGGRVLDYIGYLGDAPSSSNNLALVSDAGSVWSNSGNCFIGFSGSGNQLTVTNGGRVFDPGASVGGYSDSSNNLVLVTGVGSVWTNAGTIYIGDSGPGNQLEILGDGRVACAGGYLGYDSTSSNNLLVVSGSGSVLKNSSSLLIGFTGSGNQLIISNRGAVYNGYGYLGLASSSFSNQALVTGSGSIWSNANYLYMGYASVGNQLVVSNGGHVLNYLGDVGLYATSSNNTVIVTGSGSLWNNDYLYLGVSGIANQLVITNGGTVSDIYCLMGDNPESSNNLALVSGTGSVWNHSAQFYVGYSGSANELAITAGGSVVDAYGVLGSNTNSLNNETVVDGSVWNNSDGLYVGDDGSGNLLIITNGGTVLSPTGYLGATVNSSNNLVMVTGPGSVWSNQTLYVGLNGTANQLAIYSGAAVVAPTTIISAGNASATNIIQLQGGALIASVSGGTGQLVIGQAGPGQLILNAGTVTADALWLTNGIKSLLTFSAGWLRSGGTLVTNTQPFVVGDGLDAATFQLAGGIHSFQNGLRIRNASALTGCGTINGVVSVDPGGTVVATCSPLVFTQSLTNNGTLRASNGNSLEVYGTIVNNGTIDLINGGITNFHGAFVNNGTVLNAGSVVIGSAAVSNFNVIVQIQSVVGHNYQLQITPSLTATNWGDSGVPQAGSGGLLTFTDPAGATNQPSRFYRVLVTGD